METSIALASASVSSSGPRSHTPRAPHSKPCCSESFFSPLLLPLGLGQPGLTWDRGRNPLLALKLPESQTTARATPRNVSHISLQNPPVFSQISKNPSPDSGLQGLPWPGPTVPPGPPLPLSPSLTGLQPYWPCWGQGPLPPPPPPPACVPQCVCASLPGLLQVSAPGSPCHQAFCTVAAPPLLYHSPRHSLPWTRCIRVY